MRWGNEDGLRAAITDAIRGLKRAHGDDLAIRRVMLNLEEALQKYPIVKGTPLDFIQDPEKSKGEEDDSTTADLS